MCREKAVFSLGSGRKIQTIIPETSITVDDFVNAAKTAPVDEMEQLLKHLFIPQQYRQKAYRILAKRRMGLPINE